jgi:putative ABC transport system ATP-binding protein
MAALAGARSAVLSLGEQQRVAVARVLAAKPDIVLADEPTSSLDQANADAVMSALVEVARDRTLVVVSHDQRIQSRFHKVINFSEMIAR